MQLQKWSQFSFWNCTKTSKKTKVNPNNWFVYK